MNFAIPFTKQFNYWENNNVQIMINYKPKVKQLIDFIEQYGINKRIILIFENDGFDAGRDIPIIQGLIEKFPSSEIVMRLPHFSEVLEATLEDSKLPHYYNIFASSWDIFNGLANTSATDIFVAEDLCFSLDLIKKRSKGKKLRTYCDVCETSWFISDSIQTFFIRPEDIDLYEEYFDVIQFYPKSKQKYNIFYDIYNNKKRWAGSLKQIITNYMGEQNSLYLPPSFGSYRLNCGHRCGIEKCHICKNLSSIQEMLKSRKVAFILQK